ncbi:MAG: oligosaccharide flippase family protein [Rhodospirillaceae bacterium]
MTQFDDTPVPSALERLDQDKKDIKRGSTLSILGFLVRLSARIPFLLIAGRLYGTSTYGEYVLLTAIVETVALLSTFGLKRTIFHFMSEGDDQNSNAIKENAVMVRHALILGFGLSLTLVAVVQIFALPILSFFDAEDLLSNLILLSWAIPFISLTDICLSSTLSKRLMRYEIIVRSFVEPIALTVLSLAFFYAGFKEAGLVYAFFCAFGLAALCSLTFCHFVFTWRSIVLGPIALSRLIMMAKSSAYTCLHDLVRVLVSRIDTFAVGYFFSTSAVGIYGMAQQFLTIVEKIALSFYPMLMPVVASAVRDGDRHRLLQQLWSAAKRLIMLQLPIVALFFFLGKEILALIEPEFVSAWPVLMILSMGCLTNTLLQLVEVPLTYMRPHINVIAGVGGIILYLLAITKMQTVFGVQGVALTSVTATFVANIGLMILFARSRLKEKNEP